MAKKIHITMIVGYMAGIVMLASCMREYGTVTLGVNIDNSKDTKVYVEDRIPCWHNNDLIRVNNQTCTTSAALGSSAQITDVVESNHYRAIYPADIVGNVNISNSSSIAVNLPREQQYEVDSHGDQKVKVPMGAYSSNESLTFHNLCSLIKVVVSNRMFDSFILERITVTANSAYLSGQGIASVTGNLNDVISLTSSSSNHDVSLVFPAANRPIIDRGDRDTYIYYIVVPEFVEDEVTITLYSQGECASFEKRESLQHNGMAQVSLTVERWDGDVEGELQGLFSVSATKQVRFSQGNLQYQANTNTWRFAERQWDYVGTQTADLGGHFGGTVSGSDNCNVSSTYSGWIDLFGWGTSSWSSNAVCYQPWSTSTTYSDYYPNGYSPSGLTGTYVEADWAWHNAISNGGNATHLWRTLTTDEWGYLLVTRPNARVKRGTGNIEGVNGLILLPDSWTLPSGCSFRAGSSTWTDNSYSMFQWAQMEANGAVFLPAAGFRWGTGVHDVGYSGCYWSSTSSAYGNSCYAYAVDFYSGTVYSSNNCYLENGNSVRPVRENDW